MMQARDDHVSKFQEAKPSMPDIIMGGNGVILKFTPEYLPFYCFHTSTW